MIEACNFYFLQSNVSSLRPTLASSLVILQPLLMLRGVQHLTTSGLLPVLMNLTISMQRRKTYMYIYDNGFEKKNKIGFIQLIKVSSIKLLLIQKSSDVADLDICTGALFSQLLLFLLKSNETMALSFPVLS